MTISGDTICSVIQAFPVLLIIAQNSNRCLKTPLIYKPPTPTHSPEFYEAYDALLQSLFGQNHGCGHEYGHQYGHQYDHQYSYQHDHYKGFPETYGQKPCHGYSYGYPSYPTADPHGHHGYPSYGHNHKVYAAYPALKNSVYNVTVTPSSYAPGNQVYSTNHKYKVVVKHNRTGKRPRRREKLIAGFQNYDQNERSTRHNPRQTIFTFVPNTVRRLTGLIHLNEDTAVPKSNRVSFPSDSRSTELRPIESQNDQYGRPIHNGFNQYPQQNAVFNQYPVNNNGFNHIENQSPPFNQNSFENTPNPNTWSLNPENESKPNTQLSPVNKADTDDNRSFPDSQASDDANNGSPNTKYDQPPIWSDDTETGKLEDKNGEVDLPEEPATEGTASTTGLPALTSVPSQGRSRVEFANFQETCDTVDGGTGSCIAITSCAEYRALLKSARSNPATVQILRKAHCGFEGKSPKVCCPRAGIPSAPPTVSPLSTAAPTAPAAITPAATAAAIAPAATAATASRPEPVKMPDSPGLNVFLEPPVCGFSNASLSRVVGGDDAKLADFPWMALLGYKNRRADTPNWLCGGSLITAQHVLTAAHCVHAHETDLYIVRLGELDLARDDDGATPIDVPIRQKIKHEEYSPKAFTNDIALLLLDRLVEFTDLIRPICVPKDSELRARNFVDYKPIIAGWGDTEFRGPSATHLQALQLPVVTNEFCASAYRNYKAQRIDERVLCAGYKKGGKDACQGDSGGPLMQPIWNSQTRNTYFYQIGVVSFGRKCAEAGFPGVYTRVTAFVPWIEKTLRDSK